MEKEKYIPGVCNIGPQERKMRKLVGWIGVSLFLAAFFLLYLTQAPHWARLFLLIPALAGTIGLVQNYQHFCVNFGMRGLMNMDKAVWQTDTVEQAEFRRKDRQKALQLITVGVVISLGLTLLAYFL